MRTALTAIACLVLASPLSAQGPARLGLSSPIVHSSTSSRPFYPRDVAPTEWQKGMLIGAGVGLVAGALLSAWARGACDTSDCGSSEVAIFLVPMALFGIIGGLIGSGVHKKE